MKKAPSVKNREREQTIVCITEIEREIRRKQIEKVSKNIGNYWNGVNAIKEKETESRNVTKRGREHIK